jgi:hypothetical protein
MKILPAALGVVDWDGGHRSPKLRNLSTRLNWVISQKTIRLKVFMVKYTTDSVLKHTPSTLTEVFYPKVKFFLWYGYLLESELKPRSCVNGFKLFRHFFLNTVFGAFAKLRKATIRFVISVCLSVLPSDRMEHLDSHWTDFRNIWSLKIF